MNKKISRSGTGITTFLFIYAALFVFGILYLTFVIAIKSPDQMVHIMAFPRIPHFENFAKAWIMTGFPKKFINTAVITILSLIFTLFTNSAAAYVIARNRKKSRIINLLYYYFISALFIPFQVLMLPLVKQASVFHLDNILGISFLYVVFGLPMNTFLYTGYLKTIPEALDEAALIDGANPFQTFLFIIFPMLKPMHATIAVLSVMWTWNDFLMPLVLLTKSEHQTLQLSQYVFQTQFSADYNLAFASYFLVLLVPLLFFILCQKWIIAGVTNGAVK
jgi:raffinose/stachyose/melibiose transport system permease protein